MSATGNIRCTFAHLYMPAEHLDEARSLLEAALTNTDKPVEEGTSTVELFERWFTIAPSPVRPEVAGVCFDGAYPGAYDILDELIMPTVGHLFVEDAAGITPSMEWEVYGNRYRWQLFGSHRVVSELVQIWRVKSLL